MSDLILIPTAFERGIVERCLQERKSADVDLVRGWNIELCGFGLIAAAACTTRAISRYQPARVLLIGIAGSLNDTLPSGVGTLGTACHFDTVTCHGIGVGGCFSLDHLSADDMGWSHCEANDRHAAIGDTIRISPIAAGSHQKFMDEKTRHLLSVATASADESEADLRRKRCPGAMAEDMEGFAVALACAIMDLPVQIVRGFSNRAGDRDHRRWKTEEALHSAVNIAVDLMSEKW